MKITIRLIVSPVLVVALAVFAFSLYQANRERTALQKVLLLRGGP